MTPMTFAVPPARAWDGIVFFEEIEERPPLHLRLLLPVPVRTEGSKSQVGDRARCIYREGHLIKQVVRVEHSRHYAFEVVEQALDVGGGMKLHGGAYTLREIDPGRTEVSLATRYASHRWPGWLWRPIENWVCHAFHRHILGSMRRRLEPG
ncbi:MAG TPA: hypothetical protein VLW85_21010 [Myxococcales bacterium]|nr:hypothetical protein [Myxococcales bacterium]